MTRTLTTILISLLLFAPVSWAGTQHPAIEGWTDIEEMRVNP